ncbi:flagellar hook-basal body complex protein FliE [Hahella ganghwensis]|uniref:flagellar hook-basal body complex protein FliE n=1 Tax=Hahella ganghwensis TaxID=286420 RepID=UPI0003606AF3|nr:flagellar hook-basal body complex protein FliE [Hahella ganghwensis]
MSVESISSLLSVSSEASVQSTAISNQKDVSFVDWLGNEFSEVSSNIAAAEKAAQSLATGEAENIHQVMIALDKAQLSMSLVVEVRNKLLEGYQDIMRMSL